MIPLKAWNIIHPKKPQQHANRNISMSSCVRKYSTALSHSLLMLTSIVIITKPLIYALVTDVAQIFTLVTTIVASYDYWPIHAHLLICLVKCYDFICH